jgi:hypothetical protein
LMDFIINSLKVDPSSNHVFASGNRVLLSSYFAAVMCFLTNSLSIYLSLFSDKVLIYVYFLLQYVLGMDNMSSGKKFDLELAVKTFPRNVWPEENLLKAKIVSIAFIIYFLFCSANDFCCPLILRYHLLHNRYYCLTTKTYLVQRLIIMLCTHSTNTAT